MNRRLLDWLILLAFALLCAGCATVAEWFGTAASVAVDPEVQEHAGGVIANVISGNWWGAATSLGELVGATGLAYKAVMMRREGLRRKRGEATAKSTQAAQQALSPDLVAQIEQILRTGRDLKTDASES